MLPKRVQGEGDQQADWSELGLKMTAIIKRLRRLEEALAPAQRKHPMVQAILAARGGGLGASYELRFPLGRYASCHTTADPLVRHLGSSRRCIT